MGKRETRILHIAPQNISGVPITLVRAERALGMHSRLATFFRDPRGYEEDICLDLPFVNSRWLPRLKKLFADPARQRIGNKLAIDQERPPRWRPHGVAEKLMVKLRETWWQRRLRQFMRQIDFWNFEIYQFDGGLDFFRDGRTVRRLKQRGKKIVVLYTGSDLRTRGIVEPVDALADIRLTVELDHLALHPALTHVLFPFEPERLAFRVRPPTDTLRIGHAPTNRAAKGSDKILAALDQIAGERRIEIVLIENLSHAAAIALKDRCDIFIDQIGDLGYGINALEALALGIPTCTGLAPGFLELYPQHPFWVITEQDLQPRLLQLIDDATTRQRLAHFGRKWLEIHHDSRKIVQKIHQLR